VPAPGGPRKRPTSTIDGVTRHKAARARAATLARGSLSIILRTPIKPPYVERFDLAWEWLTRSPPRCEGNFTLFRQEGWVNITDALHYYAADFSQAPEFVGAVPDAR